MKNANNLELSRENNKEETEKEKSKVHLFIAGSRGGVAIQRACCIYR